MNTIFVSIANYRDTETPLTIKNLLDKAEYPENITIGVVSQLSEGDEGMRAPIMSNVIEDVVPISRSRGCGWARQRIMRLLTDQSHVLQIDSHTRFVKGWDTILFNMLEQCGANAMLTHYPDDYRRPNRLAPAMYNRLGVQKFDENGIPVYTRFSAPLDEAPTTPAPTPFFSGNFSFTTADIYKAVQPDPYIYFKGEEQTMSLRLFTHGVKLFTPNAAVVWHMYNTKPSSKRRLHWQDNLDWLDREKLSRQRVRHLLGIAPTTDEKVLSEIQKFGLGTIHTLKEYEQFAGLYCKSQKIMDRCRTGSYSSLTARVDDV